MNIPTPFRFTIGGFSAKRVGYVAALISLAGVPVHFYVSCEMSGTIAEASIVLFLITGVLSLISPRGTPHRFYPLVLAFIAVIAHDVFTH